MIYVNCMYTHRSSYIYIYNTYNVEEQVPVKYSLLDELKMNQTCQVASDSNQCDTNDSRGTIYR